jgi:hypothetical protein
MHKQEVARQMAKPQTDLDRLQVVAAKIASWDEVAARGITAKDRKRGRDNARRLAKKHGFK